MTDEKDVAVEAGDEPDGDVDTAETGVAEPEVDEGEAEGVATDEEAVAAPKPDAWKGVSWRHRQAAERAKRDSAWAAGVGPDVLEGLAAAQDDLGRQFAALGRMADAPSTVGPPVRPQAEAAGRPGLARKPGGELAGEPGEFAFDLAALDGAMELPDEFKNGVLNPVQERFRQYDEKFAKMEGFYQQAQKREQETQEVRALEVLDGVIASPDMAEFRELYGLGPTLALDMNGAQAKARAELSAMAWQMYLGARKTGQPVELPQAYRWAHSIINGEKIAAAERDKGRKETDKLKRTATRRPASRQPAPEETTEAEDRNRAIEFARGWWSRMRGKGD